MKKHLLVALSVGLVAGCGSGGGSSKKTAPASSTATTTSRTTGTTTPVTTSSTTSPTTTSSTTAPSAGPALNAVAPSSGTMDGGTQVTITGSGFQKTGAGTTLVLFGERGVTATPVSDTEIKVQTPLTTSAGVVDVRVVNGNGVALLAQAFTYDQRAPELAFTPAVGHYELALSKGTIITLAVKNFIPLTAQAKATFGTTAATVVKLVDPTTLAVEVPTGLAAGTVALTVEEGGQKVTQAGFLVQDALAYGDLTINEFMANPGGFDSNRDGTNDSVSDEFVEIVNTKSVPVDLTYLTIFDDAGIERHNFPNPTTLPPGGAIVVFGAGTPEGFAAKHKSGAAQCATRGSLGLNNGGDTIDLKTLPNGAGVATSIFTVKYAAAPSGASFSNPTDGKKITANPAVDADYVDHTKAQNTIGKASPGTKADGKPF